MEGMGKAWGVRRRGRLRPRAGQAVSKDGTSGLEKQGDHRTRPPPPRKTTCAGRWGLCAQEGGIDLVPAEQRQARDATCCTPAGCPGVVCSRPPLTCWVIPEPPPPNHTTGSGPEAGVGGGDRTRVPGFTSEAGREGCLEVVLPKSRPNTSRDFLQPARSSEPGAGTSSEVEARSGISAPPTWGQ